MQEREALTLSPSSPSLIPRGRFLDRACAKGLDRTPMMNLAQNCAVQGSRVWPIEQTGKRERFDGAGFDEGKRVAADAGCKGGGKGTNSLCKCSAICVRGLAFNQRTFLSNLGIVLYEDSLALRIARLA